MMKETPCRRPDKNLIFEGKCGERKRENFLSIYDGGDFRGPRKAKVGETVGEFLCMGRREGTQKAWFAMEETRKREGRERNSKGKAKNKGNRGVHL